MTSDAKIVYQTAGLDLLLRILAGEPGNYTRYVPVHDRLPAPILKLLRQVTGAANGTSNTPPRMKVSTAYGVLTLEAKWLVPTGTIPEDAARNPKSCLIAVTIELHEHVIAYAARVLRESGATPAQTKVGIHLALGKTRPEIADELGLQLCSVADHSKKLYQVLDVHNSTELGAKIWLNPNQDEARQGLWRAGEFFRRRSQERDLFETSRPIAIMPSPASARMKKQRRRWNGMRGAATPAAGPRPKPPSGNGAA